MPQVTIRKIPVDFPYEAYSSQLLYMEKVIQCLQEGSNGLLESPTGTGKTLSLLCAALAWRRHEVSKPVAEAGEPMPRPRIVYCSRTHAQLSQVVAEMKKTVYASEVRMTVLGSRNQLCVQPRVRAMPSGGLQANKCRSMVSNGACGYHHGVEEAVRRVREETFDIEELVSLVAPPGGAASRACPYYASRSLETHADIVFLPYNYLIDQSLRTSLDLNNAVVIIDEAHNIESVCADSASRSWRSGDMAQIIREVDKVIELKLDPEKYAEADDGYRKGKSTSGDAFDDCHEEFSEESLLILKASFLELELFLDSMFGSRGLGKFEAEVRGTDAERMVSPVLVEADGVAFSGYTLYLLLATAFDRLDYKVKGAIRLCRLAATLTTEKTGSDAQLDAFATLLSQVMSTDAADFYMHVGPESRSRSTNRSSWLLSYWCMHPAHGLAHVLDKRLRSLILTSGTLAPLAVVEAELGADFPVRLEGAHVIAPSQVAVRVLAAAGATSTKLDSSYANRTNSRYVAALGDATVSVASATPGGVLVFFSSYAALESMLGLWKTTGVVDRLSAHKVLVVEPREAKAMPDCVQSFYDGLVSGKGSILLAVVRGKVAEGMNFRDGSARAVIMVGLPYPSTKDPRVQLKRKFLDARGTGGGEGAVRGSDWYQMQATRAVNQCIGRVIRHVQDYGVILLADARFGGYLHGQLPRWLRPSVAHGWAVDPSADMRSFFSANAARLGHGAPPDPPSRLLSADEVAEGGGGGGGGGGAGSKRSAPGRWTPSEGTSGSRRSAGPSAPGGYSIIPTTAAEAEERVRAARRAATSSSSAAASGTTTAHPAPPSATTSRRAAKAASFASLVRRKLPAASYTEFLRIVKAHRSRTLSGDAMVAETSALFVEQPELLAGFLDFLPETLRERHRSFLERQIARARFGDPVLRSRSLAPRAKVSPSSTSLLPPPPPPSSSSSSASSTSSSSRVPTLNRPHVKLVAPTPYSVLPPKPTGPPATSSSSSSAAAPASTTTKSLSVPPSSSPDELLPPGTVVCLVCSGPTTSPALSTCGHVACRACWAEWLDVSLSCPACSTRVRVKMLRDLQLEDQMQPDPACTRPVCVVCTKPSAESSTSCLPCGHVGCTPCVAGVRKCPRCDQALTSSIQLRRVYI
jgi:regulator of telomere elongation helicase 1